MTFALLLARPSIDCGRNKFYIVFMELNRILRMPESSTRTAALVAWVQGLYGDENPAVLVGGAAVELFTGGAYTTGDIDLVGDVPARVAGALKKAGFTRSGRHWLHEGGQVFLEFPSSALSPGEITTALTVGEFTVVVIGLEHLLVDRLGCWEYWESSIDGVNAYLLFLAQRRSIDTERLRRLADEAGFSKALGSLVRFVGELEERKPTAEELESWALKGP
jgi:hypothetical protein